MCALGCAGGRDLVKGACACAGGTRVGASVAARLRARTPVATVASGHQVVEDFEPELCHVPVDIVCTPQRLVRVLQPRSKPSGVAWDRVSERKLRTVPGPRQLRAASEEQAAVEAARRRGRGPREEAAQPPEEATQRRARRSAPREARRAQAPTDAAAQRPSRRSVPVEAGDAASALKALDLADELPSVASIRRGAASGAEGRTLGGSLALAPSASVGPCAHMPLLLPVAWVPGGKPTCVPMR